MVNPPSNDNLSSKYASSEPPTRQDQFSTSNEPVERMGITYSSSTDSSSVTSCISTQAIGIARSILAVSSSSLEHDPMVPISIAVGLLTDIMGVLYGKILGQAVRLIWKTLPDFLLSKLGVVRFHPAVFVTVICAIGGLLMGLLTAFVSSMQSTFSVADFVSAISSTNLTQQSAITPVLSASKLHLLPLLTLSLITSAFGFSVGPEAPMVCAGALLGANIARIRFLPDPSTETTGPEKSDLADHQVTLAYAGAAGALTAFMIIPIAGSVFVLEMTRSNSGFHSDGSQSFVPAIAASISALLLLVGGHFSYGMIGGLTGRSMITTAVGCGLCGALIGSGFQYLTAFFKRLAWKPTKNDDFAKQQQIIVKTAIGMLVGLLSSRYPQTLFWGEGSLQYMIDAQPTPFSATKHGLSTVLTRDAVVDPSISLVSKPSMGFQLGMAKLVAISLACAGKYPGGIIFPLFLPQLRSRMPLQPSCLSMLPSFLS